MADWTVFKPDTSVSTRADWSIFKPEEEDWMARLGDYIRQKINLPEGASAVGLLENLGRELPGLMPEFGPSTAIPEAARGMGQQVAERIKAEEMEKIRQEQHFVPEKGEVPPGKAQYVAEQIPVAGVFPRTIREGAKTWYEEPARNIMDLAILVGGARGMLKGKPTEVGKPEARPVGKETLELETTRKLREQGVGEPATKPAAKQPWEVPKGEWVDGHVKSPGMHLEHVKKALSEGKPVPEAVLKEYPELRKGGAPVEPPKAPPVEPPAELPIGGEKTTPSGLSESIEQRAIANNLASEFVDANLPEQPVMSMRITAQRAKEVLDADYQRAWRIAEGEEAAPKGLYPETFVTAIETRATLRGDGATLLDLATSDKITGRARALGQRVKSLDVGMEQRPVKAIQDINTIREKVVTKRLKNVDAIKKREVKIIRSKVAEGVGNEWNAFIQSIRC